MVTQKKISIERFRERSQDVMALVRHGRMEVIVYDSHGPVAVLKSYVSPATAANLLTAEPSREYSQHPANQAGIWPIDGAVRGPARRKKAFRAKAAGKQAGLFSLGGIWKAARVSAILAFVSRM